MDRFGLQGRHALVTGASRGIGAGIAAALDQAGARVALLARDRDRLEAVAARLAHDPVVVVADLADPAGPATAAGAALDALGSVDIRQLGGRRIELAFIDGMHAVNVRAPLLLIAALLPSMLEQGMGSIINLSSVSGVVGTPRRAAYAATKGAVDAFTRSLAMELGPQGIRVNSVAPGVVDTDLWARNKAIPGVVEQIEAQTPLRRWSTPEDIAGVVVFLASDAARFITGETICADGGMARCLDLYAGPV